MAIAKNSTSIFFALYSAIQPTLNAVKIPRQLIIQDITTCHGQVQLANYIRKIQDITAVLLFVSKGGCRCPSMAAATTRTKGTRKLKGLPIAGVT